MQAKGIKFIVSEYHIISEALKHYESHLEKLSSAANENEELEFDEKLQDIESTLKALKEAAKKDYDLDLK